MRMCVDFDKYGKYKQIRKLIMSSKSEVSRHSHGIEYHLFYRIANALFTNDWQAHVELIPNFRICLPSRDWTYDSFGMMGNNRCYFFIYIDALGLLVSCDFQKLVYSLFYIENVHAGYETKKRIFNQYLAYLRDEIKKVYPKRKLYKKDFLIYNYEECNTKLLKCMSLWLQLMSKKKSENNIYDVPTTKQLIKNKKRWKVK